jgi:hypothetical protein
MPPPFPHYYVYADQQPPDARYAASGNIRTSF